MKIVSFLRILDSSDKRWNSHCKQKSGRLIKYIVLPILLLYECVFNTVIEFSC